MLISAENPNPKDAPDELEDVFDKECHLCGATEDLVPNKDMPWLFTCEDCLERWEAHREQIEDREEPPPSVE